MIILLPWINPPLIGIIPPSMWTHLMLNMRCIFWCIYFKFCYQILVYCYGGWNVEVIPIGIDKWEILFILIWNTEKKILIIYLRLNTYFMIFKAVIDNFASKEEDKPSVANINKLLRKCDCMWFLELFMFILAVFQNI